ncbi:hypothetical protein L2E82_33236 [Cichorium intybus]|uniref:Uncharacterized protein n=1 Tax=Cichorium intybus TaxID=13427 RepID=A0ACB9BJK8_CICIN|nr:hypothetical protein L2E82_33236 [Cichorium intybus]
MDIDTPQFPVKRTVTSTGGTRFSTTPMIEEEEIEDRLHNMRTLSHDMPSHKQVFAPLAKLLGMYQIKSELENLSFIYTNPQDYTKVKRRVAELCKEQEKEIEEANKILIKKIEDDKFLDLMTVKAEVRSVCKEPYRPMHEIIFSTDDKPNLLSQVVKLPDFGVARVKAQTCVLILGNTSSKVGYVTAKEVRFIALFVQESVGHWVSSNRVRDPEKYTVKLSARFPSIKFVVPKKTDSLYPVFSGASIVAKGSLFWKLTSSTTTTGYDISGTLHILWSDGSKLVVPMDILDRWFKKFQERAKPDPEYLKGFAL